MKDEPVADTSTWENTTFTRDSQPCHRRDSNHQTQQESGCSPTPVLRMANCKWPSTKTSWHPSQTLSRIIPQHSQTSFFTHLPAYEYGTVPKRRHIKFRRRGITQKKAYNTSWHTLHMPVSAC